MNHATLLLLTIMSSEPTTVDEPPVAEMPEPKEPAQELKRSVARGKSSELEPGALRGVWIWRVGDHWHVRTTTKANKHRFTGLVSVPEGSKIERVTPTKADLKDRIVLRDHAVKFDFTTNGHEDGFDFTVEGTGCVRFAIEVDGEKNGAMVKLGKKSVQPDSWHFKLCS